MRVIECDLCGHLVSGATDEELSRALIRHYEDDHPDAKLDEKEASELIGAGAYTATDS